jgi:hypothetical protein
MQILNIFISRKFQKETNRDEDVVIISIIHRWVKIEEQNIGIFKETIELKLNYMQDI